MGRTFLVSQLVFITLLNLVAQNVHKGIVLGCHDAERQALFKLKQSISDPSNNLSLWKGMDCCQWLGVACNNVTGYVDYLDLSDTKKQLTAQNLDHLIVLRHLNHLDLSFNDFQGSQIPGFIGSFQHLRFLDLSDANFSAIFPPQLGNLTKLQHLGLSGPKGGYLQWAPTLVNSQHPNMNDVLISNTRNIVQVLSRLSSLTYLKINLYGLTSFLSNSTWVSRIETLDLSENLLAGPLPNILANMTSLVDLDLSNNFFNGSIPLWVRNLRKLDSLSLFYNSFTNVEGGIIMGILGAAWLTNLDLSYNLLGGELAGPYGNFSKAITRDLESLVLSNNRISGRIPASIGNLSALKFLYLSDNRISDSIPASIGNLSSSKILDLSDNRISGRIPASIGNLSSLKFLYLSDNRISGRIPASIGNLSSLVLLNLSNNSLEGAIPEGLGQLNNLEVIDLSWNHLEGVVSSTHLSNLSSLNVLDLNNNTLLNLTFSTDWRPLFQLVQLDLSYCRIGAPLPVWIQSQKYLQVLFLPNTDISGELPHYLCQLMILEIIDLQNNKLFGTIPDCWRSKSLQLINFSANKLSGPIPESIGLLSGLFFLNLNNNSLEERIPSTFSSLSNLVIMDLGENKLSGDIPDWRPNSLRNLKFLRLRSNKLVGLIPEYLCSLPSIQLLDVANNKLTGTIPLCFGDLSGMSLLPSSTRTPDNISYYEYESVTEVLKGVELQYTSNLKFLVNLDLSSNRLAGSIPGSFTNLSGLIGLNLSHNYLSGGIPVKIGEMRSLESLDLSNNHLSGTIPPSLSQLTFLIGLNLSNNELHGQIPTGNQLQALTDPLMIYGGNPGLCGDLLPNKCKTNHAQQQPQQESNKEGSREKLLLYFVIFSGFATGFWGVVGSLLLNRRFRFALFHLVSNIADYFYVQVMVRVNRLRN